MVRLECVLMIFLEMQCYESVLVLSLFQTQAQQLLSVAEGIHPCNRYVTNDVFISFSHEQNNNNNTTRLMALCLGLPGWASTRKVKPIWILLEQETVSGIGIS